MSASPLGSGADRAGDYGWIYALYELGQTAASSGTPLQVQQDILEHIVSGFDAQSGSIALCVEGTEDLLEIAKRGESRVAPLLRRHSYPHSEYAAAISQTLR